MTATRPVAAIALTTLLLLAGCSVGPSTGGTEPTPTLTPAPVPEGGGAAVTAADGPGADRGPSRNVDGKRLAPGLRTGGVADPFALARAHGVALSNRSYTRADSRTIVDDNGTLRATRTDLRVGPGGAPFLLERSAVSADRYDVESAYSDAAVHHDGDRAAYRVVIDGNVSYRTDGSVPPAEVVPDRTGRSAVVSLLTAFEWEVEQVAIGGEPHYRLESTALIAPSALDNAYLLTDPRNAEVRLLVGPEGRVHRYRLEYETTYDGRTVGVTETARWSDVGETTVPEPGWLGQARNATERSSAAEQPGRVVGLPES